MAKLPNLEKLSLAELKALRKDIDKAMTAAEQAGRKVALEAAEAAAAKHGFKLSELMGGKAAKKAGQAAPAKYRHPENAAVTWSGRGRQPAWFKDAIKSGKNAEDLRI